MSEAYKRLLQGHSERLRERGKGQAAPQRLKFRNLLEQFAGYLRRADASARMSAAQQMDRFRGLLAGHRLAVESDRRSQEETAEGFNLLEVMQLTGKEIRHSMVLAWLLDHDYRRLGTHAQGALGFRLFLREVGLPEQYATYRYWVRREVAGDESIVDVEIACRAHFLIHIEIKIWSAEGMDQTEREWADLRRRARELQLDPDAPEASMHALFLTPYGMRPVNPHFSAISWNRIVRVLEAFANQARPADVKLFAAHYARALRRSVVRTFEEGQHAERIVQ